MTHSQESRVSSTQDNFKLSEESRSSVSALVSRLNSSALGVDQFADNEKLRGDSAKMKEQKMQDPFPWMAGFCNLCQAAVGSRNVRHLENLLNVYLENVTPNVSDCYTKPNRAAKLKKSMNDTLIFFHLFYQEIKETLEHSFYLEMMTPLVSMFMDMEIKASLRGKESLKKVASRLTSSLYIFLDNSEEHMLDAILMTRFVHKNYREICHPLLWKLLNNISTYPMYEMLYVRCLLTFKLWKKIVPDAEERKRINKTAVQKLHPPLNFMDNIKTMGNVLPRIPKTKKNITLFLMQSNFNLKNACQEFLKSVKKSEKAAYSQGLGVEIDKPLFFVNHSGDSSPRLTEKEDESDSGCSNNLINDIWSSISTVDSNVPQAKRLKELASEQPIVDSKETPKKSKKAEKKSKMGKKQKVVKCVGKKKKSSIASEKLGKQAKKLSKLKGKKKKKKKGLSNGDFNQNKNKAVVSPQSEECNQLKVVLAVTQIKDCTQVKVQPNSPVIGEHNQIREIKAGNLKSDSSKNETSHQAQLKPASSQKEEAEVNKDNEALPQTEECTQRVAQTQNQANKCDKSMGEQPAAQVEEQSLINGSVQVEECDQIATDQVSSQAEEYDQQKIKQIFEVQGSVLKVNCASLVSEELKTGKNSKVINQSEDLGQNKVRPALQQHDGSNPSKILQESPCTDEYSQSKTQQTSPQLEAADLLSIKQAFLHIGVNDQLKLKQAMLQIGDYDEIKVQKVMEQFEASEGLRVRQAMYQFTECDGKIREAKIEPNFSIPKTEKCDSPPSGQIQESELLSRNLEPMVKKVKVEMITNLSTESTFEAERNVSEAMVHISDICCLSSDKTVGSTKSHTLPVESILAANELNAKHPSLDKTEHAFDSARQDLFTVECAKDPSEKVTEISDNSLPIITDVGKSGDYCQKSKLAENSVPVSVYTPGMEVCDSSLKQEICDNSETGDNETLGTNKTVQIETDSEVEILDELKRTEAGKCDVSASEEEIVLGDDGDLLPRQSSLDNIFATGNEDLVIEMLGCSERQYPIGNVLSAESMEYETGNPPVSDVLEPEPPPNITGYENAMVDNFYSKTIKDDNPNLYDSRNLYGIDEWIHYDRNNPSKHYELERPILPSVWMEDEDEDDVPESDLSNSSESPTPKRGMGKMSYHDAVSSYIRQKEQRASTSGRHNSQGCLMMNSSESGSASTESSPILTSNASGSSSPRSDSAVEHVEGVGQESVETCDNLMKTSELGVSSERVPDTTSMRYYNSSSYPKSTDLASCAKDVGYSTQVSYNSKVGSHHMDNARVVVETMEHSLLSRAIHDRLTATPSTAETSFQRNVNEAGSHHSPLKRKKSSSKLLPEQTVNSQSSPGKHDTGEYSAAQSRATLRGRRRRGRPPSGGRGVSRSCKLSSDSKSSRKHGCSGKGRNDPEFQIASSKKSQQYDPPITRSIYKKFGISETDNMFDRL